jgi:hypothetical protein
MQIVGKPCVVCGRTISEELNTSACHLCDVVFHNDCLRERSKCPSCSRDLQELRELVEQSKITYMERSATRRASVRTILIGVAIIALGAVLTGATYALAAPGGTYLVTSGAFIVGVIYVCCSLHSLATGS